MPLTISKAPPGAPTLTQLNQDVNGDGTVDIAISVAAPSVDASPSQWELEISRSTTSGGAYTVIDTKPASSFPVAFAANTGFYYKVRVRHFIEVWSSWGTLSSALQPAGKTTGPSPSTMLSALELPAGNCLFQWDIPADDDYAFSEIWRASSNNFASAIKIGIALSGQLFYPMTPGTTYYVWVIHKDRSGNSSTKYPASDTGGVAANSRLVNNVDIDTNTISASRLLDNTITADKIASGAVDTAELAASAVTAAKIAGGAVTQAGTDFQTAALSVGTTYTTSSTATCDVTDCRYIQMAIRFRAATAGTFDVRVRQNTTEVFELVNIALAAGEFFTTTEIYTAAALPNSSDQFVLQVKRASGTGDITQRRIAVMNIKK